MFLIAAGLIVLGCNIHIWQHLSKGLGFLILLDGLMKVQMSKDAGEFGVESWNRILALSVVSGIFGILIITEPFQNIRVMHVITGCGIVLEGGHESSDDSGYGESDKKAFAYR